MLLFGTNIATLEIEKFGDPALLGCMISYSYLDEETPLLDAVIQRANAEGVMLTMCDGEVLLENGRFTRVDHDKALADLHHDLQKVLTDGEVERRKLSKDLLPHVRKFDVGCIDPTKHEPFYRRSSRVR